MLSKFMELSEVPNPVVVPSYETPASHRGFRPRGGPPEVRESVVYLGDECVTLSEYHSRFGYKHASTIPEADDAAFVTEPTEHEEIVPSVFLERFVKRTEEQREAEKHVVQGSPEWHASRRFTVTGTGFGKIMRLNPFDNGSPEDYMMDMLWDKTRKCSPMEWGTAHEPHAREAYVAVTGNTVEEVGFLRHPKQSAVGVSPDGIVTVTRDDGSTYQKLVEFKCPFYKWKESMVHPYSKYEDCIPPMYMAQMQGCMHIARKCGYDVSQCDFVVWTPSRVWIATVDYREDVCKRMMSEVRKWYAHYLSLVCLQYSGRLIPNTLHVRRAERSADEQVRRAESEA